MPKGLATLRLEVSIGPGLKDPTKSSTAAIRSSQSTALQRCEGSRPSGKSSKSRANIVKMMGPLRNASSQAAVSPSGSELGLLSKAYMAYCPLAAEDVRKRPRAQKIQPIMFLGCREITRAPIVVNNTKTSKPQTSRGSGGWATPVGVGEFRNLNNAHTLTNVSERAHSDQASQTVGRRLLPTTPSSRSLVPSATTPLYSTTVSQALRQTLRSTRSRTNFRESPKGEVRRILILRGWVNSVR